MKKVAQNVALKYAEKMVVAYKSPKEAIQGAITDLDWLPNAVSAWVQSFDGNKLKAETNGRKLKKIVEELAQILMDMPEPVTFNIYGLNKPYSFDNRADLIKFMESKGFKHTGDNHTTTSRVELQGQPMFKNMAGPMHDGGGKVRYETWELYDMLSR